MHMKKLFLLIAAAAFFAPASLFAQGETEVTVTEDENTKTIVEKTPTEKGYVVTTTVIEKKSVFMNGFWSNWELDLGLGAEAYIGENDYKVKNKLDMIAFPAIDAYLTKWASPSFGLGFGVTGGAFKGLYQARTNSGYPLAYVRFKTDELYTGEIAPKYGDRTYEKLSVQKGNFLNVYALAHADLMNMFGGYKPDRFYTIDAYAGGGVILGFSKDAVNPAPTFNAGLINKFRLNEQLSILLNLRGALVGDNFDGESAESEPDKEHYLKNIKMDGMIGGTLGLAWKLGKESSRWRMAERTSVYQYDKDIVDKLIHDTVYVKEPVPAYKDPEVWFHINFIVDRWDISKKELINIHAVADLIKSTPNTKYLVCGYADKQTATPPHNLMLSQNRADAVYNALVNEFGVNPDQLVKDYKGGVDYMFYNMKELSRCVMITSIKE